MNKLILISGFILIWVYTSLFNPLYSQALTDTLELEQVIIQSTRYELEAKEQPVKILRLTPEDIQIYSGNNVSRILEERTNAFVRDYGAGGLSTVSLRGLNPGQTQVLWNGFSINDPMSGLVDFSLLPANFINHMEVVSGNSSTAFGSGAPGGSIHLDTRFRNRGGTVWQTIGAFGQNLQGVQGGWYEGGWHGSLMFQRESSDYDFPFRTESNSEISNQRRENNSVEALHSLATLGYTGSALNYNSTIWWYDTENETPGSLRFPGTDSFQTDQSFRWLNQIGWQSENHNFDLHIFYSRSNQRYADQNLDFPIDDRNRTSTLGSELSWRFQPANNLVLNQVLTVATTGAETDSYDGRQSQFRFGIQTNPQWKVNERLRLFSGLRYDHYEISGDAVSGSLGMNANLISDLIILRGQFSRNFVAPSFNDLFWIPNGNPDLDPEINYKSEIGLLSIIDRGGISIESELTYFAGWHQNAIRWLFDSSSGLFSAQNVDQVFTSGFEYSLNKKWETGYNFTFNSGMGIGRIRSVYEKYADQENVIGNQLPYIPEWTVSLNLSAEYRFVSAGINYNWYDQRYTTADQSSPDDPLDSYGVSNFHVMTNIPIERFEISLIARVQNLFDEHYQVINHYPVPGRHFQFTVRLKYQN
jgi:vitamin B12 transporter